MSVHKQRGSLEFQLRSGDIPNLKTHIIRSGKITPYVATCSIKLLIPLISNLESLLVCMAAKFIQIFQPFVESFFLGQMIEKF